MYTDDLAYIDKNLAISVKLRRQGDIWQFERLQTAQVEKLKKDIKICTHTTEVVAIVLAWVLTGISTILCSDESWLMSKKGAANQINTLKR